MRLEHINLVVSDIDETLSFYQAAFPHWQIRGREVQEWYGVSRQWLHFGDDQQYLTFNDNGQGENRKLASNDLGLAHFAFTTINLAAVIHRLSAAGFSVKTQGPYDKFRKNAYFIDPNGFEVEFVEYLSDIPSETNNYISS